ncbi:uncharacterized protein LOC132469690 [Gadus macrocephalus]|uniref:uncharacterized protein LOC132469690 n=1 Tax=Gadus macrocephalus TaxID=80720 RepID=UPI0028CB99C1|nr:uncharacterized protein LOC132469690 [Gadus macrocephalus]
MNSCSGRQPRLPVDLAFGLPAIKPPKSHSQYVHDLRSRLEESYKVATKNALKIADRNKRRFDKRVVDSTLETGDRVLVRNVRIRGKHKLADRWESDVHVVVKRAGDLPVYTVRPENKDGPLRTLHRDLLLPCGFLPVSMPDEPVTPKAVRRPRTRRSIDIQNAEDPVDTTYFSDLEDEAVHHDTTRMRVEFETRILSNTGPVPLVERKSTHETPHNVVVPVEMHPVPVEPARDHLPEVEPERENLREVEPEKENSPEAKPASEGSPEVSEGVSEQRTVIQESPKLPEFASNKVKITLPVHVTECDAETPPSNIERKNDQPNEVNGTAGRSLRSNPAQPDRLHYRELGNPLTLVIQTLLQSLSVAFTASLNGPNSAISPHFSLPENPTLSDQSHT